MTIARDYTNTEGRREVQTMQLAEAIPTWPWLEQYRPELEAGLAVFAEEGVFVEVTVWDDRQ